jgi:hypothetical protein
MSPNVKTKLIRKNALPVPIAVLARRMVQQGQEIGLTLRTENVRMQNRDE